MVQLIKIARDQRRWRSFSQQLFASYSTNPSAVKIDKENLAKLRKQTGYTFANCSKALLTHSNDYEKALKWLNEEARKEGWSKALKLQNRPMSQGVIGVIANENQGLLLEMNCETDFVARSLKFQELVSRVANICFEHMASVSPGQVHRSADTHISSMRTGSETIADVIAKDIGSISENVRARRAVFLRSAGGSRQLLANYVHTSGFPDGLVIEKCRFGKYASLVLLESSEPKDLTALGLQLGQHVVGMNPKSIGSTQDEGKSPDSPDETRLLFQEFLLQPEKSVKDLLLEENVAVLSFVRFGVGEEEAPAA